MTYPRHASTAMPQMRDVDTSAKAGERRAYSVITVNSVGLKSVPSEKGQRRKKTRPSKAERRTGVGPAVIVTTLGAVRAVPTAMPDKGDAPASLYGGGAASRDDCLRRQAGDSFHWKGSGQITWNVQADRAGDYEVALNHAAEPVRRWTAREDQQREQPG